MIPKIEDGNDFGVAVQVRSAERRAEFACPLPPRLQQGPRTQAPHAQSFLLAGKGAGTHHSPEDQGGGLSDHHCQVRRVLENARGDGTDPWLHLCSCAVIGNSPPQWSTCKKQLIHRAT